MIPTVNLVENLSSVVLSAQCESVSIVLATFERCKAIEIEYKSSNVQYKQSRIYCNNL